VARFLLPLRGAVLLACRHDEVAGLSRQTLDLRDATGHKDICHAGNAILLRNLRPLAINDGKGQLVGRWVEPSLEEIIANVEYAYQRRAESQARGAAAAEDMKQWPWKRAAETIISTIGKISGR
jgi:hypothetical protein